jgi:hypothetical protein
VYSAFLNPSIRRAAGWSRSGRRRLAEVFIKISRSLGDYRGEGFVPGYIASPRTPRWTEAARQSIAIPAEEESMAPDTAGLQNSIDTRQMSECVRFIDELRTYRAVLI